MVKYSIGKGELTMSKWSKVEEFLNMINIKEIFNQKFFLYGWEPGYEKIPTENLGYIPFYDDKEMEIKVDILPDDSPLKANRKREATKYITIHNTGMGHPTATAKGLNEYIHTTTRVASWHFSIDDTETYQQLKLDEVGWHAGDGHRTYQDRWVNDGYECIGGGNENSIGIESCVYAGVDFIKVMRRLAKLTAMLLIKYDLGIEDVKQHYHFSGKNCPQVIREAHKWEEFLYLVKIEYFAQTQLKGVKFVWKSLSPDILNNEGKVIFHPGVEKEVEYEVLVTMEDETKTFKFSSTLLERKD